MEDYEDNDIGFVSAKQVMKLLEIQYRLRNLKAVRVDSTVRVLSQAEFLCEKGNTISQFRYGLNGLYMTRCT